MSCVVHILHNLPWRRQSGCTLQKISNGFAFLDASYPSLTEPTKTELIWLVVCIRKQLIILLLLDLWVVPARKRGRARAYVPMSNLLYPLRLCCLSHSQKQSTPLFANFKLSLRSPLPPLSSLVIPLLSFFSTFFSISIHSFILFKVISRLVRTRASTKTHPHQQSWLEIDNRTNKRLVLISVDKLALFCSHTHTTQFSNSFHIRQQYYSVLSCFSRPAIM